MDDDIPDEKYGTKALFAVSTLGNLDIRGNWESLRDGGYWHCEGGSVRKGSAVDKAVKSGHPLPFIIAITSTKILNWELPWQS